MPDPLNILIVFGTRPEAIKLSPVIRAMRSQPDLFNVKVCVTAQHRDLLDAALAVFSIRPDIDLGVMTANQSLAGLTSRILDRLDPVLESVSPDFVVVQGDTTTTFAASLASFYRRIPCGHVEAGLRTGNLDEPFPEELNRVLTAHLASLHFAPTSQSAQRLQAEGIETRRIHITGNTGIDALLWVRQQLAQGRLQGYSGDIPGGKSMILVTAHRRESFGQGFEQICDALIEIASRPDVHIIYPVHPNPNVRAVVNRRLAGVAGISLIEPLDYVPFVDLMSRASILLTDSGGIQEEAPSLGKPVLVMRDTTERQEAIQAGTATLVGTEPRRIVPAVAKLLETGPGRGRFTAVQNPFGDGHASGRIASAIHSFLTA